MNDSDILAHIEQLVEEEHRLFEAEDDRPLAPEERKRLEHIGVQLDRFYDLLRQRRARREAGQNPDQAHIRPGKIVENYVE